MSSNSRATGLIDKEINYIANLGFLSPIRKRAGEMLRKAVSSRNGVLIFFNHLKNGQTFQGDEGVLEFISSPAYSKPFELAHKIKAETDMLLNDMESWKIYDAVWKTRKIEGDIAEVGVYMGGSAKLMCEAASDSKRIYLFDTFEGLPRLSEKDKAEQFFAGQFPSSLEKVRDYLKDYRNVYLHKGIFPSSGDSIKNKRFSFVHLDVDLYESTAECLKFFYPRMNKGGIIISHDYQLTAAVRQAVDDFFKDKPEPVLEMPGCDQCLIVKTE